MLKICVNPAFADAEYDVKPCHYITQTSLLKSLSELGIKNISQLISILGNLCSLLDLEDKLNVPANKSNKLHKALQDNLCVEKQPRQKILPHILTGT